MTDHAFNNVLVDDNSKKLPRILENIVYNELIRRNYNVKIGKLKKKEIDFICKRNDKKMYVQVSYLLSSPETIECEFNPLIEVPDKYDTYVLSMYKFDM